MQVREVGLLQILRDFAISYQSLWVLFGLCLSKKEWKRILSALLIAAACLQLLAWGYFIATGEMSLRGISGFYGLPGNEVITPLFPLSFVIWETRWAMLLGSVFGLTILGQYFNYLKRNWVFSFLALATPVAVLSGHPRFSRMSRFRVGLRALAIGLGFGVITIAGVTYRTDSAFFMSVMEHPLVMLSSLQGLQNLHQDESEPAPVEVAQDIENQNNAKLVIKPRPSSLDYVREYLFHGDMTRDQNGEITSIMTWRWFLWRQAIEGFLASPILGQGFGPRVVIQQWGNVAATHKGKWISGPHNSFLTLAFRLGLLGMLPLLGMLIFSGYRWFNTRGRSRWTDIGMSCLVSVTLYAAFNVCLENPQAGIWFWLFLGFAIRSTLDDFISEPEEFKA